MQTKIIIRVCCLLLIATLFSCVPEEQILPKSQSQDDRLLISNLSNSSLSQTIRSQEYQPTGCTETPCNELLPKLNQYYQDLANETCEIQWYCATCCLENDLVQINAAVKPDSENCMSVANGQSSASYIPIPKLAVAIMPIPCYKGGAMLLAVNPKAPGNPAYSESNYIVNWYRDGQLIGTGVMLEDCICGQKISVTVENTQIDQDGTAQYWPKPCGLEE